MPIDVWLMGSALKTRRQDYVYINCLLDSETMNGLVVVYFRDHVIDFQMKLEEEEKGCTNGLLGHGSKCSTLCLYCEHLFSNDMLCAAVFEVSG